MGEVLYTIIIKPLELIFELIFAASYDIISNPAVNLLIMSLAINLLVLPLYRRADIIQQQARKRTEELTPMMDHIKKYFKGDERVMIMQAFYKVENYSPLSSLKGMVSLVLQIPFFIAAYQFLSHLSLLKGQGMGPVSDLSQPDGLIVIGSLTINLLPVLMTLINVISSAIYTKGQPFKDKIVLYLTAAVFLVLLYNSPSGLVFYWTLNNVFSLVKNIVFKFAEKTEKDVSKEKDSDRTYNAIFILSSISVAVLVGFVIPSAVISSSVDDFVSLGYILNPALYVWHTAMIALGFFVLWLGLYYYLVSSKGKIIMSYSMLVISICSLINYIVFSKASGMLFADLTYDYWEASDLSDNLITTAAVICVGILVFICVRYVKKVMPFLCMVILLALTIMSTFNMVTIYDQFNDISDMASSAERPQIKLSTQGKNVVVLMMDRGLNGLVPYIFEEDSELAEKYDGFTYYPNTISYGISTNLAVPALFGGYDYTPENMNLRSSESLKDKHNEALLVLPLLFSRSGYRAVAIDPPYSNYRAIRNTEIYDEYEDIKAYLALDILNPYAETCFEQTHEVRMRNFLMYSLFRISPEICRDYIYDGGNYHAINLSDTSEGGGFTFPQYHTDTYHADGISPKFISSYSVLESLISFTDITEDGSNNFIMMDNETTHSPMLLQEPDYELKNTVTLTPHERTSSDGRKLNLDNYIRLAHYHINMASYKSLGKWFDYLRANGVWDNTRIIIVSDHGFDIGHFDDFTDNNLNLDIEFVNPVLLVKDFNSSGYTTSDEFMTNADVPYIATKDIIDSPVNPFTGNPITNTPKTNKEQRILASYNWNVRLNNGNTYEAGSWYSVHDNIFDKNNWEYLGDY